MGYDLKILVLNTFRESLIRMSGKSLHEIILFGSQARGDGYPDYDFYNLSDDAEARDGFEKTERIILSVKTYIEKKYSPEKGAGSRDLRRCTAMVRKIF